MSCNHMNGGGGRRRRYPKTLEQVQGLGIEAIVHNGCPTSATKTNGSPPPVSLNGTKPPRMVNGDINHVYEGDGGEELLQKTLKEKETTTGPAAGICSHAAFSTPGGAAVNGPTSLDAVALSCKSDQMARGLNQSAATATRKKKKCHWKRFPTFKHGAKAKPPPVQIEEEDWEKEIQDLTLTNWNEMLWAPYGPEDVIHFTSRGLTPGKMETVALTSTENHRPCTRHPKPVPWLQLQSHSHPIEPGQFEDADE